MSDDEGSLDGVGTGEGVKAEAESSGTGTANNSSQAESSGSGTANNTSQAESAPLPSSSDDLSQGPGPSNNVSGQLGTVEHPEIHDTEEPAEDFPGALGMHINVDVEDVDDDDELMDTSDDSDGSIADESTTPVVLGSPDSSSPESVYFVAENLDVFQSEKQIMKDEREDYKKKLLSRPIYLEHCKKCRKPADYVCQGCFHVAYCSTEHQQEDWDSHYKSCVFYSLTRSPSLVYRGPLFLSRSGPNNNTRHPFMWTTKLYIPDKNYKLLEEKPFLICPWPRARLRATEKDILPGLVIRNLACFGCGKVLGFEWIRCKNCNLFLCSENCLYLDNHKTLECEILQTTTTCGIKDSFKDARLNVMNMYDNEHYRRLIYLDIMILRLLIKLSTMQKSSESFAEEWTKLQIIWQAESLSAEGNEDRSTIKKDLQFNLAFSYKATKGDTDLLWKLFCIVDSNSFTFELPFRRFRVLSTVLGLAAHSCNPNCQAYLSEPGNEAISVEQIETDPNDLTVVVKSGSKIGEGAAITFPYVPLIFGTQERRNILYNTYLIWCTCPRCSDPTELSTFTTHVSCAQCTTGILIPSKESLASSKENFLKLVGKEPNWECWQTQSRVSGLESKPGCRRPSIRSSHFEATQKIRHMDYGTLNLIQSLENAKDYLMFNIRNEDRLYFHSTTLKMCEDILRGTFHCMPDVLADELKDFSDNTLAAIVVAKKFYSAFMKKVHPGFEFEGYPIANFELCENELRGREGGSALLSRVDTKTIVRSSMAIRLREIFRIPTINGIGSSSYM